MGGRRSGMPQIPVPEVDPDNEEFVIFLRSVKSPMWVPCTMIKGNAAANQLVKGAGEEGLQRNTLIRSLGESVYGNEKELLKAAKKMSTALTYAKEFVYGFKIRDKSKPERWYVPEDIIVLPPKDQLPEAPLQGVQN